MLRFLVSLLFDDDWEGGAAPVLSDTETPARVDALDAPRASTDTDADITAALLSNTRYADPDDDPDYDPWTEYWSAWRSM